MSALVGAAVKSVLFRPAVLAVALAIGVAAAFMCSVTALYGLWRLTLAMLG